MGRTLINRTAPSKRPNIDAMAGRPGGVAAAAGTALLGTMVERGRELDALASCLHDIHDGSLLVAVDDAHWADADSLRVLADTAEDLQRAPLAIVLTCRPAASPVVQPLLARLTTLDWAVLLEPAPLSEDGVAAVLRAAF